VSHTVGSSVYISERLSRSVAAVRVISDSNVISILITCVEESSKDVKMMRLAIAILAVSVMVVGNSLAQRSVYQNLCFCFPCCYTKLTDEYKQQRNKNVISILVHVPYIKHVL